MMHLTLHKGRYCSTLLTCLSQHGFDAFLIMAGGSSVSINQTRFFNNTGAQGGALAAGNGTTVDISSSVFDSNVASNGGECCTLMYCDFCRHCSRLPAMLHCEPEEPACGSNEGGRQPDRATHSRIVPCRQHLPQRRGLCSLVQRHSKGQHCADQRWWPLFGEQVPH